MTIREAVTADIPRLVEMGLQFIRESRYQAFVRENPAQIAVLASALIDGREHTMLVAERDGRIVGMLGLHTSPHVISGDRVAGEVVFWVDPSAKGVGIRLMHAAERWAANHGAIAIQMVSPTEKTDTLYERCGYAAVERAFQKTLMPAVLRVPTPDPNLIVMDGVLEDPSAYRAEALAATYQDHVIGADTFRGIALAPPVVGEWIAQTYPPCRPMLSFFRQSPEGQAEPNFIHSDRGMGEWTALLYLNPDPPEGDGTTFWEHVETEAKDQDGADWTDPSQWRAWHRVSAAFNRLVLFPASYLHSRSLRDNYGTGASARLVQVTFGGY